MSLDLEKLKRQLDETLDNETTETLIEWLKSKRAKTYKSESQVEAVVRAQKALDVIHRYGMIDGAHHKQWLLNEIIKILADDYGKWIKEFNEEDDGVYQDWDVGIAP